MLVAIVRPCPGIARSTSSHVRHVREFDCHYAKLTSCEDAIMLWTIAVVLLILWALGFFVFPVAGSLIHLLLVIAVIVVIYRLITGRPVV